MRVGGRGNIVQPNLIADLCTQLNATLSSATRFASIRAASRRGWRITQRPAGKNPSVQENLRHLGRFPRPGRRLQDQAPFVVKRAE